MRDDPCDPHTPNEQFSDGLNPQLILFCSILFQRGIYPAEYFHGAKKYGMTVMVAEQEELDTYLKTISNQMQYWVEKGQLQRVSLVLISHATKDVLEQWTFKVESDREVVEGKLCDPPTIVSTYSVL